MEELPKIGKCAGVPGLYPGYIADLSWIHLCALWGGCILLAILNLKIAQS